MIPSSETHRTTGDARPVLVWRFDTEMDVLSSAPAGGGLGRRSWVIDAEVPLAYDRSDLAAHARELADGLGCHGPGVTLLTATDVTRWTTADDGGVDVVATVGLSKPTWAAGPEGSHGRWRPGTINIIAFVPVALAAAALVNAVITVTEAKSQALFERRVPGTGTASDAVCIVCPPTGAAEPFAGPRSPWGSRLARATHAAVTKAIP